MTPIYKQPLLHFLILGALIFVSYPFLRESTSAEGNRQELVVTPGRIEMLSANFLKVWQRPPSSEELDGLIDDFIREEIYYREALAIGLDRDDTIVRRRMRQKMEFITADLSDQRQPSDQDLSAFLEENRRNYQIDPEFDFQHIYLDPSKRKGSIEKDAQSLLKQLKTSGTLLDFANLGDRIMLENAFESVSQSEVDRLFGTGFGETLNGLEIGSWQGPLKSGYGMHLIRVDQRTPARSPELDEVRTIILRDWQSANRQKTNENIFSKLKERYTITIEKPESARALVGTLQ